MSCGAKRASDRPVNVSPHSTNTAHARTPPRQRPVVVLAAGAVRTVRPCCTVRVAPRFGIWQGLKMKQNSEGQEVPFLDAEGDEVWKLRCIDDFKFNGVNEVTWLSEQLVMPSFEFPARVAAEFSSILDKQGPLGKRARASDNGPGLLLGLDDLFAVSPLPCLRARHASKRKHQLV